MSWLKIARGTFLEVLTSKRYAYQLAKPRRTEPRSWKQP